MIASFRNNPGHPELLYLEDEFDDSWMPSLYKACHCLVQPYRGEGFCLPIVEAMACGLATIVTGYGPALDFCTSETTWLIPAVEAPFLSKRIADMETADYPWLAEPDLDALISFMRNAYENRQELTRRGIIASEFISRNFTWQQAGDKAAEAITHLIN